MGKSRTLPVDVATIDGGAPAAYMGMPAMKAEHITLELEGSSPRFEIQLLEFDPSGGDDPGEHPTNLFIEYRRFVQAPSRRQFDQLGIGHR